LFKPKGAKMKRILVGVVFVLALTLTACGSNKVTLNVTATDEGYDSTTYTVPAGKEVTLNMTNNGVLEHEFAILKLGEHVTPPFGDKDEDKILWELDGVQAGTNKSATFTAPTEPGEYDIICGIPGHIEKGMIATLIVK
jgi:plastocyanin